jgi:hypothetical protein
MYLSKDYLVTLRSRFEGQKVQAIATANQAAGAIALIDALIVQLDVPDPTAPIDEPVPHDEAS